MTAILSLLTQMAAQTETMIWPTFLVFMRVGAVMALLPAFGEQSVPQRVRLGLSLCFTAIVAPAVWPDMEAARTGFYLPILTEVVAGLALGIGLRLFVMALQMAGTIAAQASSLSQLFAGMGQPQPAMSNLFVSAGLALAVLSGLHVRAAELLILSYQMMPPGQSIPGVDLAGWGLGRISQAFALAFSLAAPFVIASTVYNVALGVINRAMPQLMVMFVGAPALTMGGLVLLAVAAPLLLAIWSQAFEAFLQSPLSVAP